MKNSFKNHLIEAQLGLSVIEDQTVIPDQFTISPLAPVSADLIKKMKIEIENFFKPLRPTAANVLIDGMTVRGIATYPSQNNAPIGISIYVLNPLPDRLTVMVKAY